MFCFKCGAQLPCGAKYCMICGQHVPNLDSEHTICIEDTIENEHINSIKSTTIPFIYDSILEVGKDKVFYNTTMKEFDGYYRIFESSTAEKYEYIGVVSVDVHKDLLNDDHVISIRYSDRIIADYIRRSIGKFRW